MIKMKRNKTNATNIAATLAAAIIMIFALLLAPPAAQAQDGDIILKRLFPGYKNEEGMEGRRLGNRLPYRDGQALISVREPTVGTSEMVGNTVSVFGKNAKLATAMSAENGYSWETLKLLPKLPSTFSIGTATYDGVQIQTVHHAYEGDFNGDGKKNELVMIVSAQYRNSGTASYGSLLLLCIGDAEFSEPLTPLAVLGQYSNNSIYFSSSYENAFKMTLATADVNGDGVDEIVAAVPGTAYLSVWSLDKENAAGWNTASNWQRAAPIYFRNPSTGGSLNGFTIGESGHTISLAVGDVDGDGYEDIVYAVSFKRFTVTVDCNYDDAYANSNTTASAYIVYGSQAISEMSQLNNHQPLFDFSNIQTSSLPGAIGVTIADMDGDGNKQILVAYQHGVEGKRRGSGWGGVLGYKIEVHYYSVERLDFQSRSGNYNFNPVTLVDGVDLTNTEVSDTSRTCGLGFGGSIDETVQVYTSAMQIAKLDGNYGRANSWQPSGSFVVNGAIFSYIKGQSARYETTVTGTNSLNINREINVISLRRAIVSGDSDGFMIHYRTASGASFVQYYDRRGSNFPFVQNSYVQLYLTTSYGSYYTALPELDNRSTRLRYKGGDSRLFWSDPQIVAALASPPYFKSLPSDNYINGSTTYGKTTTSGSGTATSVKISRGGYVSTEVSVGFAAFDAHVMAVVETSVETLKVNTTDEEDLTTTSHSVTLSVNGGEDAVFLMMSAYDVYPYEIIYPTADGGVGVSDYNVVIPRPGKRAMTPSLALTMSEYNDIRNLNEDTQKLLPAWTDIFKHSLGDPTSYLRSLPAAGGNIAQGSILESNQTGGFPPIAAAPTAIGMTIGTESTKVKTLSGNAVSFQIGAGASAGTPVGGVRLTSGVSGSNEAWLGAITFDALDLYYEGAVAGQLDFGRSNFTWEPLRYLYQYDGGNDIGPREFPVITYIVHPNVTLPTDTMPETVTVVSSDSGSSTVTVEQVRLNSPDLLIPFTVTTNPAVERSARTELVGATAGGRIKRYESYPIDNSPTYTRISIDSNVMPGVYPLRLEVGGVPSNEFTIVVVPSATPYVANFNNLKDVIDIFGGGDKDVTVLIGADFNFTEGLTIPANKRTLTIKSENPAKLVTLTRDVAGCLFTVNSGASLVLEDVIIDGNKDNPALSDNNGSLVCVMSGGDFTMKDRAVLRNDFTANGVADGGMLVGGGAVANHGTFTMTGGEISGNTTSYKGGGSAVYHNSTFTMSGGEITGNHTAGYGGGVHIFDGTFTMSGGEITGNTAEYGGGGVYVIFGTFTMSGGEITDNTASSHYGGGVHLSSVTFAMSGGKISGNASPSYYGRGGGVYLSSGTFTMTGGEITDNTASNGGGGVSVSWGTFTMNDGEISGNTIGGGVDIFGTGSTSDIIFTMNGGEISGNTDSSGGKSEGVSVLYGTFAMTGGKISGNRNGVSVTSGTFTMTGGEISENKSSGVAVGYNGAFTMVGGEISGNAAVSGGGVYSSSSSGTFTMTGGEISGNTASSYGGGVYIYTQTFTITINGGKISGNTGRNNAPDNVYLRNNIFITLGNAPILGMDVGIQTETPSGLIVPGGCSAISAFHADEPGKVVTCVGSDLFIASVSGVTVNPSSATVQTGTSNQFGATVTGTNNPPQVVTWSVSGNSNSGTSISASGLLTVASGETATTLTVRATSTVDTGKSGTAAVTVSHSTPQVPTVTSVTVNPTSVTLQIGACYQFGATVAGTNNPSQGVTWSVSGNNSGETSISTSGLLCVAAGETAATLTVRATSTVDIGKYGTSTVTLNTANNDMLTGIEITTLPKKMVYTVGQTLDLTGMVVTATYVNGDTANVTGYTTSPSNGSILNSAGTQYITVYYTEGGVSKDAGFSVTVNATQETIHITGMRPEFQIGLARNDYTWVYEPFFPGAGDVEFTVAGESGPFVLWIGIQGIYSPAMWYGYYPTSPGMSYDISYLFYDIAVPTGVSDVGISFFEDVWYGDFNEGDVITLLKTDNEGVLAFERGGVYYEKTFVPDGSNPFPGEEPGVEPVVTVPSATVEKLSGGKELLTISLTETLSDGSTVTGNVAVTINENTAGYYTVGSYVIYVDSLGSGSIRRCYIVNRD